MEHTNIGYAGVKRKIGHSSCLLDIGEWTFGPHTRDVNVDKQPTRCHFCVILYLVLCRGCRKADSLPAATAQYQQGAKHYSVVSSWRWPYSCPKHVEQIVKEKLKDNTKVTSSWFIIHTELRCTVNRTSEGMLALWERLSWNIPYIVSKQSFAKILDPFRPSIRCVSIHKIRQRCWYNISVGNPVENLSWREEKGNKS